MGNPLLSLLLYLLVISSVAWLFQSLSINSVLYAENLDRYWTVLLGEKSLPPSNTDAIGYVGLKFQDDLTRLVYTVNAENIGNVTGIYIYKGDKNQNGTIVLDLLKAEREHKSDDPKVVNVTSEGKMTGTLSIGGATKNDLQGVLKGKTLSGLHNLMVNGTLYISIHTKDFPQGEIRGNSFVGIDRLFPDIPDVNWK
jgi:hypothetical protein